MSEGNKRYFHLTLFFKSIWSWRCIINSVVEPGRASPPPWLAWLFSGSSPEHTGTSRAFSVLPAVLSASCMFYSVPFRTVLCLTPFQNNLRATSTSAWSRPQSNKYHPRVSRSSQREELGWRSVLTCNIKVACKPLRLQNTDSQEGRSLKVTGEKLRSFFNSSWWHPLQGLLLETQMTWALVQWPSL